MLNRPKFQKLILGNIKVLTGIERSRILFSAGMIVLIVLASLFFLSYDLILGYTESLFVYPPFIFIFALALHLIRSGKHDAGRLVLLVALNFFVYLVMSSIPEDSMSAIFYLSIIVVEYVLLGNDKKIRIIALISLTFALYAMDTFSTYSLLPMRDYDETTLQVNKIIDFAISMIVLLLTLKLLIDYLQDIIAERTRKNEELQQLNNELDKYAYTITHDLRGPIHAMLNLIKLGAIDSSNYEEYLAAFRGSLQNLSAFVEDVTEQARNRNFEVKKENVDLLETVETIWELVRYTPEAKGVELIPDISKELIVKTDKRRLIGILNNLMTNAIRYHDHTKDFKYIKVSGKLMDDAFQLIVEDNGSGIEFQYQEKVFDMFYRASNVSGGSGLGLFTVKESVGKLSGQIALESTVGKGTTFRISLPLEG